MKTPKLSEMRLLVKLLMYRPRRNGDVFPLYLAYGFTAGWFTRRTIPPAAYLLKRLE